MGSLERFFAMLVEHYGGDFPLWLAPEQLRIVPVSEKFLEYGREVVDFMRSRNIRAEMDIRNEKVGYKVRDAEVKKIPYVAVAGEKEATAKKLALRKRKEGELGVFTRDRVLEMLEKEISSKK
jgi:threonyl-tRNA synthetase